MADHMFRDVVESSVNVGGTQRYTVLLSIAAHALVIAATVIVPIVATDSDLLPLPPGIMVFVGTAPLPAPPPAPPSRAAREAPRPAADPATAPIEAPHDIIPERPLQSKGDSIVEPEGGAGLMPGGDVSVPPAPPPPPPPPPMSAPVRPGGDIKPPVKVKDVAPVYPAIAQAARVQGLVIIEATIGPAGKVQDARVLRSIPLLDAAALDAVRQWVYTPTLLNGLPVAIVMTVTVDFRLR